MELPLKNIVWIASYPKSGNTWVRFMACNLLYGRQDSAAAVEAWAPDVHEMGPQLADGAHSGLVKTHYVYTGAMPLADRTAGAIYVVRRPADVLTSNFYYAHRSMGTADDSRAAFDRYFESFLFHRGDPRWTQLGMGTWEDNVRSWLTGPREFPVVCIKYEDLSVDPQQVCRLLAQALRPNAAEADIRAAVDNSSFRHMRQIEDEDIREQRVGIFYKPYLAESLRVGNRFMRQGSVGDGAARLSDRQRMRLAAAFAPLLAELGYPDPT